jgi:hypothetical protein
VEADEDGVPDDAGEEEAQEEDEADPPEHALPLLDAQVSEIRTGTF